MTTTEKGKHGGARPNAGGARPGAGRPKNDPPLADIPQTDDERAFLRHVMNDAGTDLRIRVDAAKALLRGAAEVGKKDAQAAAAKKAGGGRFAPTAPPLKLIQAHEK